MTDPSTKAIRFTRDSVCMGDDVDAPHEQWFEIERGADARAIAEWLQCGRYLADVGSDANWILALGTDRVVFGLRQGRRFVLDAGAGGPAVRAADVDAIHVGYAAQQDPEAVARRLRQPDPAPAGGHTG